MKNTVKRSVIALPVTAMAGVSLPISHPSEIKHSYSILVQTAVS